MCDAVHLSPIKLLKAKSQSKDDFLYHVTNAGPALMLFNILYTELKKRHSPLELEAEATQLMLTSAKHKAWDRRQRQLWFYCVLQNTGVITTGSLCCMRAVSQAQLACAELQRAAQVTYGYPVRIK